MNISSKKGKRHSCGCGVQGFFPYRLLKDEKGELITRGYEEELNVLYQNDMPQHSLGTYNFKGASKIYNRTKEDLRVLLMLSQILVVFLK